MLTMPANLVMYIRFYTGTILYTKYYDFYEDNGLLYFKDNNSDLYLIEGTNKIKVQDYVKPVFTERMELTEFFTLNGLNVKIQCNLRYMRNSLHYKIKVYDNMFHSNLKEIENFFCLTKNVFVETNQLDTHTAIIV